MKKRFTSDVVAGRAKFRMLTFYCHYFHNLIPETNEQTGFFFCGCCLKSWGDSDDPWILQSGKSFSRK